jgi:hypothetical protein
VQWIEPDPATREEIKRQADDIRNRISEKAKEDSLVVTAMPRGGSFAKKTGLRRHMRGKSEVEGQDIDISFVVKPPKEGEYLFEPMVTRFLGYANDSYPKTEKETTKSSVKLKFTNTLSYDIVPLFATKDPERQILIRTNGDKVETSVQKHTDFIRNRTKQSEEKKGMVLFNECVRLMKWWRDVRCAEASYLNEVPSIIIDLLCAKAFDKRSVQTTYAQTLADWCTYLAHLVTKKERIEFTDYGASGVTTTSTGWQVIDPVNSDNNIAQRLQLYEIDELAEWLQNARDIWSRVIAADLNGDDSMCLDHLVMLFGTAFKNHCEDQK